MCAVAVPLCGAEWWLSIGWTGVGEGPGYASELNLIEVGILRGIMK